MSSSTNRHQEVAVLDVDKDSQLVLLLTVLPRETRVGIERLKGDSFLSDAEGKEDTGHWGNVQGMTSISYDVLREGGERERGGGGVGVGGGGDKERERGR